MLLPYAWLQSFLPDLPSAPKLAEVLMMHGMDVEGITNGGQALDRVVVGEIVAIRPHPDATKLQLADVSISPGEPPLEIVCGAPNIEVGQKAPVALLGATLPNGLTIEKRAIRGVESNGMLCAVDELGLGKDHSGIMVLDANLKVGTPIAEALGLNHTVIDVTLSANRADLMSMRGLAREIGAMLGQTPVWPPVPSIENGKLPSVTVDIADKKQCSVFTARMIRGVAMKPTPAHIVSRLRSAGMRSINCIVDITNYVMLEYGQPLHAYDAAKVQGAMLTVRPATKDETVTTLDGKVRTLMPDMLVIADQRGAIGLAGVMGGESTEVSDTTQDILLEAAIFNPVSIRKTSRQLGLVSEASKRFEKGLWPSLPVEASAAAATMIVELCGGMIEPGLAQAGKSKAKTRTVSVKPEYINQRLGMDVSTNEAKKIVESLGFSVQGPATAWKVTVPEWRLDVDLPEDMADEVGRMAGYEQLPTKKLKEASEKNDAPDAIRFKEEVKNILVDLGLTEIISHAFYGPSELAKQLGEHIEVANPLDKTQQLLRKSLLPYMTEVLKREADAGKDAAVFEIGRVFLPDGKRDIAKLQPWKLAIGTAEKTNKRTLQMQQEIITRLGISSMKGWTKSTELVRGRKIEFIEIDLKQLMQASTLELGPWEPGKHIVRNVQYRAQSKYPAVVRDIAFWWPGDEQSITQAISDLGIDILRDWQIKDRFTKDGKTSFAVAFTYQASDRTLIKAEVDKIEKKVKDTLMKYGAMIR